jgi:hypothetical protein
MESGAEIKLALFTMNIELMGSIYRGIKSPITISQLSLTIYLTH